MKILFLDYDCFNKIDTIDTFRKMGHEVFKFFWEEYNALKNDEFKNQMFSFVEKNAIELSFSYNYFPLMAEVCKEVNIPYVSFVYDSPYAYVYSYTVAFPTNHIFLFDRSWVNEFKRGGLNNVHYMVLPGNVNRIDTIDKKLHDEKRTKCDISFVGKLYNEKHNFYERLEENADSYLKGYLEGIVESQQKIYGQSIVEPLLTDDIMDRMKKAILVEEEPLGVEPKGYRYANYFIKRKITQIERIRLVSLLGKELGDKYDVRLFTPDKSFSAWGIKNMGAATYETEMPFVFRDSKININISLRSINTGIPLRCIDIMSMGGFLLSNYQEDLTVDFVPGEDFEFFGDPDEMVEKARYYLEHEDERRKIAESGRRKVAELYSYEKVFGQVFDIVFGKSA